MLVGFERSDSKINKKRGKRADHLRRMGYKIRRKSSHDKRAEVGLKPNCVVWAY